MIELLVQGLPLFNLAGLPLGYLLRRALVIGILDDVGNQAFLIGRVVVGDNHAFLYRRMLAQNRFDFLRFDTKAANLHLIVNPPHKFKVAIGERAG